MATDTAPACSCPPGTRCIPCTTGTLEVTVYLQTVCWDTDRDLGLDSPDVPFSGVTVTVTGGPKPISKVTDGTGIAIFDELDAGEVNGSGQDYTVTASKDGFEDKSDSVVIEDPSIKALASGSAHVDVQQTSHAIRIMRRRMRNIADEHDSGGLECTRKHSKAVPSGQSGPTLSPILWADEPWILQLRDWLWIICFFGAVVSALIGAVTAPPGFPFSAGALASAAIFLAFVGYLGGVIFGIVFGTITIVVAFALFLGLIAVAIIAAVAPSFLPLPPPDPVGFPILAGMWAGFGCGYVPGRHDVYNHSDFLPLFTLALSGILGCGTAIALSVVLQGSAGAIVAAAICGAILGLVAGLLGFCFQNEGKTHRDFVASDYLLPYAGERYCVQGHRGFISHLSRRNTSNGWLFWDEEPSYDWSLPEGGRLLACKEGHILAYDDSKIGAERNTGNSEANFVAIRHFDRTVAKYLHLMTNGIGGPGWNVGLGAAVVTGMSESDVTYPDTVNAPNPLHVHAGQVIGGCGDVGISMFPHLHLYVLKYPPKKTWSPAGSPVDVPDDSRYIPFKFQDPDTHSGRCWSMRKYASSNVDKGLLVIPPDDPPFRPGGKTTNGDPVPGSPLAGPSSSSSGGPAPPSVTPPVPPTPSSPPPAPPTPPPAG